ncbi:hypothetical protein [Rhizobium sp. LC145]|jgi:hypothetical protein|uniref:hypothetical protein n=1 Tax=Rhizobium sp. LC145 TaxID=1120688 RepID=UPI00062A3B3B|nr:hypothetical protein [Rhizobium sp. LC145]KKX25707.1 hypothetical protein YH62_25120 [Rhizobium sp. LC145]TKT58001.1 hypothetical protein FDR95_12570 [Rhizobiaceae bacterium LC148]
MREETEQNITTNKTEAIGTAHIVHSQDLEHPHDVLMADNITNDEKRAILASWASDSCAVESMPAWRRHPGSGRIASYDEVLAALKALDGDGQSTPTQNLPLFGCQDRLQRQVRRLSGFHRKGRHYRQSSSSRNHPICRMPR